MKRTCIFLTDKQLETLKAMSRETGLSFAEVIRRAVDDYIEKDAFFKNPDWAWRLDENVD